MRKPSAGFWILAFLLTAMGGYWIARSAAVKPRVEKISQPASHVAVPAVDPNDAPPKFRRSDRSGRFELDDEAATAGAIQNQRALVFKDRDSLEAFLARAGDGVKILDRLSGLNALRIGFLNANDLADLLSGEEEIAMIFPVEIPTTGQGKAQEGAVALGAGLLNWLGVTQDNSTFGAGVRIAILDTGVAENRAFKTKISWQNLVSLPSDLSTQNGHGSAVASLIIGQGSLTPGVAPGADIVSIRIANDLGQSDSFLLAQGIVAAVEAGAQLINISMGSLGDSAVVRNAIEYARAAGSIILAAAGNNGTDRVSYPAANNGVLAIGAVDAAGNHMDFSNTGKEIAMAAPGYGINAAWLGDQAASVSGTSFSSPIVAGAIAAIMSQSGNRLTAPQAVDLLYSHLNDSGSPGVDPEYGAGMPDLGRVFNASTRGIYDAAVGSQNLIPAGNGLPYAQLEVLVQNRGTETLINTAVEVSAPSGVVKSNITSLPPGAVSTVRVPISQPPGNTNPIQFDSRVRLTGNLQDAKPSNDHRADLYVSPSR